MAIVNDDPHYWMLTIPGLTEEGAGVVADLIHAEYPSLQVSPCDPRDFLPMFMDEFTVRLVKSGLERLAKDDGSVEAMLFDLDEWLNMINIPKSDLVGRHEKEAEVSNSAGSDEEGPSNAGVSGNPAGAAREYGNSAARRTGANELTDAIGEGLAGVSFAILELAAAIRGVGVARGGPPERFNERGTESAGEADQGS